MTQSQPIEARTVRSPADRVLAAAIDHLTATGGDPNASYVLRQALADHESGRHRRCGDPCSAEQLARDVLAAADHTVTITGHADWWAWSCTCHLTADGYASPEAAEFGIDEEHLVVLGVVDVVIAWPTTHLRDAAQVASHLARGGASYGCRLASSSRWIQFPARSAALALDLELGGRARDALTEVRRPTDGGGPR
ncbi:hypothetical protein GCM10012275_38630 [Longimycelium tulufanense]|uniref:Uncharacterized protein n=1 Tax=Longimycelium tulufanense TaxID=907463 RepID=A0A8J3FW87_9PSEU|nr:hypothetical protein [Longimycelium tulufanense]GGM64333.1 hypothetical protein GCM10012275_38630 [Longimycelium tulufanense]